MHRGSQSGTTCVGVKIAACSISIVLLTDNALIVNVPKVVYGVREWLFCYFCKVYEGVMSYP